MTIVYSTATITMDQVGWQCLVEAREACVAIHSWLAWVPESVGTVLGLSASTSEVAFQGWMGWLIAALAVVLGFAYSAAAVFRARDLLSGSEELGPCLSCSVVSFTPAPPPAFDVAAFATGVFAFVLVLLVAALGIRAARRGPAMLDEVVAEYPPPTPGKGVVPRR